ncbi:DNA primase small subunit-like [Halichondria panicea]|uniref:DNA primase small subunit-like n=1 Tax=Halichondria panicea TaxID=6063 RepID=UPI00312B6D2F
MELDLPVKEELDVAAAAVDEQDSSENKYDRSQLPHLLKIYYKSLFPYDKYWEWLHYGDDQMFSHREFSFTLEDDVYVRYQSFESRESLEEGIRKANPYKIDIGAIFNSKPCLHSRLPKGSFRAVKKELVFDIDMTDYDDIRTCCREAQICPKCWKFIIIAIKIVDRALREDFGFKHLLWVYSGRRGVHCWVCDRQAIALSQEARVAIVEYLTLIKGGEQQGKKVKLPRGSSPMHPSIRSALDIIKSCFKDLLVEQDFFETAEQWKKVLALLPKKVADDLDREWTETPMSSLEKWGRLKSELKDNMFLIDEIMLQWSYPRLDVNVSKGINHLLKSPFCVHPKTGRVCVPIETGKDMEKLTSFDPFAVPTVKQICDEFISVKDEGNSSGYNKSSLGPYMQFFCKRFLLDLKKDAMRQKKQDQQNSLEF